MPAQSTPQWSTTDRQRQWSTRSTHSALSAERMAAVLCPPLISSQRTLFGPSPVWLFIVAGPKLAIRCSSPPGSIGVNTDWFKYASQTKLVIGLNSSRVAPVFAVPRQFDRKRFGSKRFSSLWVGRRPMHNSSITCRLTSPDRFEIGKRPVRCGCPLFGSKASRNNFRLYTRFAWCQTGKQGIVLELRLPRLS